MRSSVHSPSVRSRYDYYYSQLSPASSAANFLENQQQSLFGDPVPPATNFLETLDNHLYGSLRTRNQHSQRHGHRKSNDIHNNNDNDNDDDETISDEISSGWNEGIKCDASNLFGPLANERFFVNNNRDRQKSATTTNPPQISTILSSSSQSSSSTSAAQPTIQIVGQSFIQENFNSNMSTFSSAHKRNQNSVTATIIDSSTSTSSSTTTIRQESSSINPSSPIMMFNVDKNHENYIFPPTTSSEYSNSRNNSARSSSQQQRTSESYHNHLIFNESITQQTSSSSPLTNSPNSCIVNKRDWNHRPPTTTTTITTNSSLTPPQQILQVLPINNNQRQSHSEWLPSGTSTFKSTPPPPPPQPPPEALKISNKDSHSQTNRNTHEIGHGDAMIAIIQDSSTSTSGSSSEEQFSTTPPPLPRHPPPQQHQQPPLQSLSYTPIFQQSQQSPTIVTFENNIEYLPYQALPNEKQQKQQNNLFDNIGDDNITLSDYDFNSVSRNRSGSIKSEPSKPILRDTVTTGAGYRINQPRQHKKASFAILNEFTPRQSRAASPTSVSVSGRVSPFRGKGFKSSTVTPTLLSASTSNQFLNLEPNGDIDPLRSVVQFNINEYDMERNQIGGGSISAAPSIIPRSILQNRYPGQTYDNQRRRSSLVQIPPSIRNGVGGDGGNDLQSSWPLKKTVLPSELKNRLNTMNANNNGPNRKMYNSTGNLPTTSIAATPNCDGDNSLVNPKSYHKGLIHIVSSSENSSPSKIPRRKSLINTPSGSRRNSLITNRRSGTMKSDTTSSIIDLGITAGGKGSTDAGKTTVNKYHQPQQQQQQHQQSRSVSRISKPSALSPIVGTPNKDSDEHSMVDGDFILNDNDGNYLPSVDDSLVQSPTRIPIRTANTNNSLLRTNSIATKKALTTKSLQASRTNSRDPSPSMQRPKYNSVRPNNQTSINNTSKKPPTGKVNSSTTPLVSTTKKVSNIRKEVIPQTSTRKVSTSVSSYSTTKKPDIPNKRTVANNNLKRETSILKREPSTLKRETSNLRRETSSLRRETSNASSLKRDTLNRKPPLKREPSNVSKTNSLKRQTSKLQMPIGGSSDSRLEKKNSFKKDLNAQKDISENENDNDDENNKNNNNNNTSDPISSINNNEHPNKLLKTTNSRDKLIPMTKSNVVSMTTAAIASQPVQITTAVTNSNTNTLNKSNSSNQLLLMKDGASSILEKSQKTLESIQKTVTDATDEIQRTIDENLTNLKSLECDMKKSVETSGGIGGQGSNSTGVSTTTTTSNKDINVTKPSHPKQLERIKTDASIKTNTSKKSLNDQSGATESLPLSTVPVEASVSVIENQPTSSVIDSKTLVHKMSSDRLSSEKGSISSKADILMKQKSDISEKLLLSTGNGSGEKITSTSTKIEDNMSSHDKSMGHENGDIDDETKSNNIKDTGGISGGNNNIIDDDEDDTITRGCCTCSKCCAPCNPCCTRLCWPCIRLKKTACCERCCKRKKNLNKKTDDKQKSETNSITDGKSSFWKKIKCCKCCRRKKDIVQVVDEVIEKTTTTKTMNLENSASSMKERGKCSLCLSKFLCCRKTNKIESTRSSMVGHPASTAGGVSGDGIDDEQTTSKCCFCIPCRRKTKTPENIAWSENRRDSIIEPAQKGCCGNLCAKLLCCRKKESVESRRTSMNSKKQSIAPTIPPEDNRPKLDMSLVEHTSMMKAAIPILPICLAWFCLLCNCFIPGLGTILSGIFCLCLGIPRFSQHDGARARIGSFVINCIVGVAQAFTLLFCLVGWGWSIWWGTIMLKLARKRRKLKQAELENEEAQEEQTTSSNRTAMPPLVSQNHRDVESGS